PDRGGGPRSPSSSGLFVAGTMSPPWIAGGLTKARRGSAREFLRSRSFRASARVGGVVHAHELIGSHVRVALRRRQAAVAQQLLDHAEVGPGVEQMCRERVKKRVRGAA